MARILVGTCGKCGRDLKVQEGSEKALMHLTCKCGWSGYVGYTNCCVCGKKLVACKGAYPPAACAGSCEEKLEQKLRPANIYPYTSGKPEQHQTDNPVRFKIGALPSHWKHLYDSSFWDNEQVPHLTPIATYPYMNSLDVSPDQQHLVWLSPDSCQKLEVVVYSLTTSSEVLRIPYPTQMRWPSYLEPSCLFVGNDRILVISQVKSYMKDGIDEVRLALYELPDGSKLDEVDIPDCSFCRATVRHNTKTIVAIKRSDFNLLLCKAENDNLACNTINTDQILAPGPNFGHDGKLYAMFMDGLYLMEEGKKKRIMDGANCVCFLTSGKVCCGGGSDFNSNTALYIKELNTGESYSIPWGRVPISHIESAGNDYILIANEAAGLRQSTGRFSFVSLFSLSDKTTKWTVKLDTLEEWRNPLLFSSPEEKWALVTSGLSIRRISLPEGKSTHMIPAQPNEFIEARYLPSKRVLCIARNPNERIPGKLEWYEIE